MKINVMDFMELPININREKIKLARKKISLSFAIIVVSEIFYEYIHDQT
jgi:hypothetical protein